MRLAGVIDGLDVRSVRGDAAVEVTGVQLDSRAVAPGDLFACVRGEHADGHEFASEAVARGAVALLCEQPLAIDVTQVVVPSVRVALGPVAAAVYGRPADRLDVVGVTGTNGKTTVTHLLAGVLTHVGRPAGVIGTLSGARTTPEAPELHRRLADFAREGRVAAAVEVSSHALSGHRVDGIRFAVAVFTNLTREHLDFHGTMEAYFRAKASLFVEARCRQAVVNVDDPRGRLLVDAATVPTTPYSLGDLDRLDVAVDRCSFTWRGVPVRLPLGGRFNAENALAAAETARVLGVEVASVADALEVATPVPGRFEVVEVARPFRVIVDYAHTPDGLRHLLSAARAAAPDGRVLVVFGCGGDRDATKRPEMGAVAEEGAEVVILTSDNPRSEDPDAIISAVLHGARRPEGFVVEPDRRAAIAVALERARPGDVVVVAGKGHETTQIIGDEVIDFDDRVVVRQLAGGSSTGSGMGAS